MISLRRSSMTVMVIGSAMLAHMPVMRRRAIGLRSSGFRRGLCWLGPIRRLHRRAGKSRHCRESKNAQDMSQHGGAPGIKFGCPAIEAQSVGKVLKET